MSVWICSTEKSKFGKEDKGMVGWKAGVTVLKKEISLLARGSSQHTKLEDWTPGQGTYRSQNY